MKKLISIFLTTSLLIQAPSLSATVTLENAFSGSVGFAAGYSGKLPNRASDVLAGLAVSSLSAAVTTMRFMKGAGTASSSRIHGNASTEAMEFGLNIGLLLAEVGISSIVFAGAFLMNAGLYGAGYGTGWVTKKVAEHYKK